MDTLSLWQGCPGPHTPLGEIQLASEAGPLHKSPHDLGWGWETPTPLLYRVPVTQIQRLCFAGGWALSLPPLAPLQAWKQACLRFCESEPTSGRANSISGETQMATSFLFSWPEAHSEELRGLACQGSSWKQNFLREGSSYSQPCGLSQLDGSFLRKARSSNYNAALIT